MNWGIDYLITWNVSAACVLALGSFFIQLGAILKGVSRLKYQTNGCASAHDTLYLNLSPVQ